MKIKSFKVTGLHGEDDIIDLNFNDDLNILTGRNGAGKTTILKLMWYLISGNCDKAIAEIKFNRAELVTDLYSLDVILDFEDNLNPLKCTLKIEDSRYFKGYESDVELSERILKDKNRNFSWFFTQYLDSSFFMPTFRMIEGGFTTEEYDIEHDVLKELYLNMNKESDFNDIQNSLENLSKSLSRKEHSFLTTISAKDIDIFLVKKYAEIIKRVNRYQKESINIMNQSISKMLKNNIFEAFELKNNDRFNELSNQINLLNQPLNKLKDSITDFLPQFRIIFDEQIKFFKIKSYPDTYYFDLDEKDLEYESEDYHISLDVPFDYEKYEEQNQEESLFSNETPVSIDRFITISNLSAGEKQLLTFISYNIFHSNTIFFIDEPELSLHVDWQSKLFSLLKEQNPTNQFIISTHSPFIYSIFPDKEIVIDSDKGCSEYQ